jgi:hypothetical protein
MSESTNDARVNVYINGQSGIAEIDKLERKMKKLGLEINRVGKDSDLGKKLTEDLRAAQSEMDQLTKKLDLTKMSIKQLESESRRLRRLRDMAQPGTEEFKRLNGELDKVGKRMKVVQTGMGSFGQSLKLVWDQLKGFNLAVVGVLAGGLIVDFFKDVLKSAADLSDQLADVQKTTGMTTREVKALNKELSAIDTRTSTKELRNMAIVAGQLGIAKEDVADFVKAVDVANVALGDEFTGGAQQVAEEMGKLRNVFTDFRSNNVSNDILQISNALNVLGAEGAATGPVVAENANRIGGFGIQAGLSTGQVLGLGAAMQELNINSERGSTAVVRILQKMLTDVETFAAIAGESTQEFKKTLDTDLFGAFMKVVKGSKEVGSSNTALAKVIKELDVDGAGASEVMAKFGGNLELVERKAMTATNALKSQSSIMNEFNLKNENAAAVAEKVSKAISGWFSSVFVSKANEFLVWLGQATGLTQTLSQKLEQERMDLLVLESRLNNVNMKQETRVSLIRQLQEKYPSFLSNLDAEKVTSAQLGDAIRKVNDQLINKIILQKKSEESEKNATKAADLFLQNLELEKKIQSTLVQLRNEDASLYIPQGDVIKKAEFVLKQMGDKLSAGQKFNPFGDFRKLENDLQLYKVSISAINGYTATSNRLLNERDELMKKLGVTLDETAEKEDNLNAGRSGNSSGSSVAPSMPGEDEEKKKAKAFKLGIDLRLTELERYSKAMQEVRQEIENLYKSETEIAVQQATEKTDALLEENSRMQSELMFAIQFGSKTERQFAQKKLRELMQEEVELNSIRIRQTTEAEKKMEAERVKTRKEAAAKILNELKTPQQREIDEIQSHYAELIALAQKYGIDTSELVKKREALILETTKKYNLQTEDEKKKSLERIANLIGQYGQAAQNILNPVAQLVNNSAEKQIALFEDQANKRITALDKQRERGILTEDQYQKKKLAIEKKAQKEIGKQRRKQAIADRIAAQAQVIFSTAEAIAKAFAASPKTFGLPWSAAAAVMGGLQSAAIWSAPMPTYRKGGVSEGPSHENGGISMINSQTGRKVGEMEGGEPYMILSRNTYANNGPLIDSLLNASMNEGGRMLTPDELMSNTPMIEIPRIGLSAANGRRAVNRTANPAGGSNGDVPKWAVMLLDKLDQVGGKSSQPIEVRAKVVLRDVEETKEEYQRLQDLANIGSSQATTTKTVSRTSSSSGAGTTTVIEGAPGAPGEPGADGTNGTNGVGLEHYWFHKY